MSDQEWCSAREAGQRIGVTYVTIHRWRLRGDIFSPGTVRKLGILQPEYQFRSDEVERLRKIYLGNEGNERQGKGNGFAVSA